MRWTVRIYFTLCMLCAYPVVSEAADTNKENMVAVTVPVFEGDTDRPYTVVGEIKDNLRKPFAFMANPSKETILAEIWERAKKMGADAVINARFGRTERTLFNHGRTPISGTAIKYTADVEANK